MEWLDRGSYRYEALHPPLARVSVAIGPRLAGLRSAGRGTIWQEGAALMYDGIGYWRTLSLARLGVLPYLALLVLVVAAWAGRIGGWRLGAAAAGLVTLLPPVLAHAGLATTDVPFTAVLILAVWLMVRWIDAPGSVSRGAAFGASAGLAMLTKFSALVFLPIALAAVVGCIVLERSRAAPRFAPEGGWAALNRAAGKPVLAALAGLMVVVWAGYRFQIGFTDDGVPVPASALWTGLSHLGAKAEQGADAYLLGEVRTGGWWYFFPVTLAVKTPLPFLALAIAGIGIAWRGRGGAGSRRWTASPLIPPAIALLLLLSTFFVSINIGVRHVLPLYPLLAIPAATALLALWSRDGARALSRGAAVLLAGWLVVDSARAHPDYLAYFNEVAASQPARVLVNGDLDWGQDLERLALEVDRRGIDSLAIAYFGSADPRKHLTNVRPMSPYERPRGWFAVSEAVIAGIGIAPRDAFAWVRGEAGFVRVGASIRLYPGKED